MAIVAQGGHVAHRLVQQQVHLVVQRQWLAVHQNRQRQLVSRDLLPRIAQRLPAVTGDAALFDQLAGA